MHTKCWAQCLARVKTITILSCRAPYCTWKRKQNLQVFVPWNDTAGALLLLSHWMINNIIQHLKCSFTLWASATWPVKWMDYIKLLMEVSSVPKGTVRLLWSNAPGCKQIPKEPLLKVEMGAEPTLGLPGLTLSLLRSTLHPSTKNVWREKDQQQVRCWKTHTISPHAEILERLHQLHCAHTPHLTWQHTFSTCTSCFAKVRWERFEAWGGKERKPFREKKAP